MKPSVVAPSGRGRTYFLVTLGRPSLHLGGPGDGTVGVQPLQLALLTLLVEAHPRAVSREFIADLLWPRVPAALRRRSLSQALYALRGKTTDDLAIDDGHGGLAVTSQFVDSDLRQLREASAQGDWARVCELNVADFLQDYRGEHSSEWRLWRDRIQMEMDTAFRQATYDLVSSHMALGEFAAAVERSSGYASRRPLDDLGCRLRIQSLLAAGRELEAIDAFREHERLLREVAGDSPDPELEARIQSLRRELEPHPPLLAHPGPGLALASQGATRVPRQPPRPGTWRRRQVAIAVCVVAILAVLWDRRRGAAFPEQTLVVELAGATPDARFAELRLAGGEATLAPLPYDPSELPSPSMQWVATRVMGKGGYELAIRDERSGVTEAVLTRDGDERAIAWSPDDNRILYRADVPGARGRLRYAIYSRATDSHSWLLDRPADPGSSASWNPLGHHLAVTILQDERSQVHVVDAGGAIVWSADPSLPSRNPRWSPDGQWLLYEVTDQGQQDLAVRDPLGRAHRLTVSTGDEIDPVWLGNDHIAYVASRGGRPTMVIRRFVRETTAHGPGPAGVPRLSTDPVLEGDAEWVGAPEWAVARILRVRPGPPSGHWLETIGIEAVPRRASPGQSILLGLSLSAARGEGLSANQFAVRWSVLDSSRAQISEVGRLEVLETGAIGFVADVAAWRADTAWVESVAAVAGEAAPLLDDDWTRGLDSTRWLVFGFPKPLTRPGGGPEQGGVFLNNGDNSYDSGVISRTAFPLRAGLSVDVWARVPIDSVHAQSFAVSLDPEQRILGSGERRGNDTAILELTVSGYPEALMFTVFRETCHLAVEDGGSWHRYTVQLRPDGIGQVLLHGRLLCETSQDTAVPLPDSVYVLLHGRSVNTEILHGRVRVYPGARWLLPATGAQSRGRR